MKFVVNKMLVEGIHEFKDMDEAQHSPLATALFQFLFVKEVFMDNNYLSITKYDRIEWETVVMQVREFVRDYIQEGNPVVEATVPTQAQPKQENTTPLTDTEQEIVKILEEYIKPAVASDEEILPLIPITPTIKPFVCSFKVRVVVVLLLLLP